MSRGSRKMARASDLCDAGRPVPGRRAHGKARGRHGRPMVAIWCEDRPLFDLDHPFFRPLWARIVTVAVPLCWSIVEIARDAPFWAILFAAAGLYAAYRFFVAAPSSGEDE